MGLLGKSRKEKLCEKRVLSGIAELKISKNFRKFRALYGFTKPAEAFCGEKVYFNDELKLYREEVLYDFCALAPNKGLKVQLC